MRRVRAHLIVTLDGVVGFDAVGATIARLRDKEEVLADFFTKVAEEDAMLMGRVTYQEWAQYWPTSTHEPFASHINNVAKYVMSKSLVAAPWGPGGQATILRGDLTDAIVSLKRQVGKIIGVHGSPTLIESLIQAQLIDELRLEVYPVIAGTGARLFHDGRAPRHLQLVESRIAKNGVAMLTYSPAQGDA